MHVDCLHCGQTLEYSDRRPSFCAYCGKAIDRPKLGSTTSAAEPPTVPPEPGTGHAEPAPEVVGGYRLLRLLGTGGMGSVHEAEEMATGRRVALKLIAAEYAATPDAVERFRREGRLASAIAHPRCVFVLAADEEAGRPYIVMELMPGTTLKELVEHHGALRPAEALAKILDVIDGLREAHRLGVVHRDVKPSNCFLEAGGRVKVGDFGLSKSLLRAGHLTRTGSFVGTPLFASPEQVRGETVGPQSDVYSVAATLYFLLTGRAPFESDDATITLARIASDPAPPMRTLRPALSPALDEVVLRGLERDQQRRWRDLDEFRAALLPFLPGKQTAAGLGFRFGAFLIDYLVLMVVGSPIALLTTVATGRKLWDPQSSIESAPLQSGLGALLWVLYFGVLEGLWGCALGKWSLGLRIQVALGSDRPGFRQIALRTLLFYLLANLGSLAALPLYWGISELPPAQQAIRSLLYLLVFFPLEAAGIGVLLSTMRARNGYRGLHDLLSGTRVVRLPEEAKRRSVRPGRLDQALTHPDGLPERVGAYAIHGALRWDPEVQLLLGEDVVLKRQVVIWLRQPSQVPLDHLRQEVTRPTRLRWLAGGRYDSQPWDAFLAPAGKSLPDFVATEGSLAWPEVRLILEQLTEELTGAAQEGTLPALVREEQVWVQPGGQVQLLDWPFAATGADSGPKDHDPPPARQALAWLGQVAVLALEGHPWRADEARNPECPVHAPVPEHAGVQVGCLLGLRKPYQTLQEFETALTASRDRPVAVTRRRRAAQLGVAALVALLMLWCCVFPAGWIPGSFVSFSLWSKRTSTQRALRNLEDGARLELAVSTLNPDPLVRLHGLCQWDADLQRCDELHEHLEHQQRELENHQQTMSWFLRKITGQMWEEFDKAQEQSGADLSQPPRNRRTSFRQEAATLPSGPSPGQGMALFTVMYVVQMLFFLVLWVLWAFLWRGGLSLRWLALTLTRADGRKAARWQCALRALLVWAPVIALLIAAVCLDGWYWSAWSADEPGSWVPWLSWALWWIGLLLLPVYVLLAILFPRRCLHDWVVGTYLVPR
jgi:uncharacterized RDD family membrane protein YckC